MGSPPQQLIDLKNDIADCLEGRIRPLFLRQADYKFTFIARIEGHEEADIVVTEEDEIDKIKEVLERSKTREGLR